MDESRGAMQYYNKFASKYEQVYASIQQQKYELSLDHFYVEAPLVCDFGGGSGLAADFGISNLLNFDLSLDMIRQGLQKRMFQAVATDIQCLPIRKMAVDHFITYSSIQNTASPVQTLGEIKRVATGRSSGIITFLRKSSHADLLHKSIKELEGQFVIEYVANSSEDVIINIHTNSSSSGS